MTTLQNPGLSDTDFRTALDIDMATKGINERELGKLLGLSQQSISKWRHRGFPPLYRVEDLKAVFGPDSRIGRMDFTQFAREIPKLRISAPPNVPETFTRTVTMPRTYNEVVRMSSGLEHIVEIRAWRSDQELQLMRGLPGALRLNLQEHGEADYVSDRLAVEVLMSPRGPLMVPERLADRVLKLLALRAKMGKPNMRLAVAVVEGKMPSQQDLTAMRTRWDRTVKNMMSVLESLDVSMWVVGSGTDVAMAICEVEGVDFEPVTPRYEEEFEE